MAHTGDEVGTDFHRGLSSFLGHESVGASAEEGSRIWGLATRSLELFTGAVRRERTTHLSWPTERCVDRQQRWRISLSHALDYIVRQVSKTTRATVPTALPESNTLHGKPRSRHLGVRDADVLRVCGAVNADDLEIVVIHGCCQRGLATPNQYPAVFAQSRSRGSSGHCGGSRCGGLQPPAWAMCTHLRSMRGLFLDPWLP